VQAPAGVANARHELTLNETVHVLVIAGNPRGFRATLLEDRGETAGDGPGVGGVKHACARERFGPRQTAGDVIFKQAAVEWKGDAKIKRRRIRRRIKPA
jgi:hypothetical protein